MSYPEFISGGGGGARGGGGGVWGRSACREHRRRVLWSSSGLRQASVASAGIAAVA